MFAVCICDFFFFFFFFFAFLTLSCLAEGHLALMGALSLNEHLVLVALSIGGIITSTIIFVFPYLKQVQQGTNHVSLQC